MPHIARVIEALEVPERFKHELSIEQRDGSVLGLMQRDVIRSAGGVVQIHPAFGHAWYRLLRRAVFQAEQQEKHLLPQPVAIPVYL